MFAIYKWNKIVQIKFNIRCITKKKTHIFTCAHMYVYTHSQLPSVSQKHDLLFFVLLQSALLSEFFPFYFISHPITEPLPAHFGELCATNTHFSVNMSSVEWVSEWVKWAKCCVKSTTLYIHMYISVRNQHIKRKFA